MLLVIKIDFEVNRFYKPTIMKENEVLSRFQVVLMAVAAGASAANISFYQPILKEIALSFDITESQAGLISMLSQIGFGLGLFFITPLGDKVNRKKLILTLFSLLFITLVLMAAAVSVFELWLLSILIGLLSVSPQVILPMAAGLDQVSRGKTVGTIFSGILAGILAARIISGFVGEWLGWRYVYGLSALLILSLAVLLRANLPDVKNEFRGHYFQLLRSSLLQLKRFSLLRQTSLAGGLLFGVFCSFWTTLTFYLSGPPFNFHPDTIGLFGFIAIAGPLLSPTFGKLADKGNTIYLLLSSIVMIILSMILIKLVPGSVAVLAIAVLLLNIGIPANQVTNVSLIYTLDQSSNSRINTVYMTSYFIGGSIGTFVGLLCWKYGGWNWVSWQMMLFALAGMGVIFRIVKELGQYRVTANYMYIGKKQIRL